MGDSGYSDGGAVYYAPTRRFLRRVGAQRAESLRGTSRGASRPAGLARLLHIGMVAGLLTACNIPTFSTPPPAPTPTPPPIPTRIPEREFPEATPTTGAAQTTEPERELPTLMQLTEPGCCPQPFWSPDGKLVQFIDQPDPEGPTGVYGVPVTGGPANLVGSQVGLPSTDGRYLAYLNREGQTVVEDTVMAQEWVIPNEGRFVFFSPGSLRLAWAETVPVGGFDEQRTVISISNIDGSEPHEVATVFGGGIAGWLDDSRLLLVGKESPDEPEVALFWMSIVDGSQRELVRNQRIRGIQPSPGGRWVLYAITFDEENPENNGMWIVSSEGEIAYKLEVVGSAQWRDENRLLVIPMEPDAPSHRLWQFHAGTGEIAALTDPDRLPFRVAGADWSVAPTGDYVAFVDAEHHAIWVISLPPEP